MQCCSFGNISFCVKVFKMDNSGILDSVSVVSIDNCYCERLFLSLFLFRVFFVWCNKVIFVLTFGTQYYFCSMFCTRTEVFYEGQTHNAIFVAMYLCHWLCSQDVIVGMYMVFLYILVFALYVQNRKSFCHCRTQLRRCKSFKPCWLLA